mgnify:CR=1 FL=1
MDIRRWFNMNSGRFQRVAHFLLDSMNQGWELSTRHIKFMRLKCQKIK